MFLLINSIILSNIYKVKHYKFIKMLKVLVKNIDKLFFKIFFSFLEHQEG